MKKSLLFVILLWAFCITGLAGNHDVFAQSEFPQVSGFPQVVVVSGTNFDMGYQYALQAAPLIYLNKQKMRANLEKMLTKEVVDGDIKVWGHYLEQYDPKFVDWLKGISKGMKKKKYKVTYDDLVLMVVYPEELWARPDKPYPELKAKFKRLNKKLKVPEYAREEAHMCSAFAANGSATPDGNAVVSIVAGADEEVNAQIIMVAFPSEGNSFIAFPFAGEVTSNMAFTSKFAWVEPAAPTWDPVWGIAPEVYFHYITQYSESVDDAIQFIKDTPRAGVTGNFLFADASGAIKALEANAQHYADRNPGDAGEGSNFLIMTNHFAHPDMVAYNGWSGWPMPPDYQSYIRYATLWQWLSAAPEGSMDMDFVKSRWTASDWYDPDTTTWHNNDPLSPNVPGNGATQHAHIYYPADKTAYILYGHAKGPWAVPYGTGEYGKLKLLDTPLEITRQANNDADTFCLTAIGQYYSMVNDGALTDPVFVQQVWDMLGQGNTAIDDGLAAEAYAYYATDEKEQMGLYGSALSSYFKAQLICQIASTKLFSVAP